MQTSQLLSSLLNRTNVQAPKQIELTPGQIFKGTVLKLHPDQMATVQIGGIQVNAKLETNLEAGQKAWLQVQPSSGVVTLKVLQGDAAPQESKDASFQQLMSSLGLADTPENNAIVRALVKQNLPVNKEILQAFGQIAKELGAGDATIDAFMLAMRRSLPLTQDVVRSLQAFLSKQTITDAVDGFLAEAEAFMQEGNRQGAPHGTVSQQAGVPLKETLQALKDKLVSLPLPIDTGASAESENALATGKERQAQPTVPNPAPSNGKQGTMPIPVSTNQTQPTATGESNKVTNAATAAPDGDIVLASQTNQKQPSGSAPASNPLSNTIDGGHTEAAGGLPEEQPSAPKMLQANRNDQPIEKQPPISTNDGKPGVSVRADHQQDAKQPRVEAAIPDRSDAKAIDQTGEATPRILRGGQESVRPEVPLSSSPNRVEQAEKPVLGLPDDSRNVPKESTTSNNGHTSMNKADLIKELFQRLGVTHERDVAGVIKGDPQTQARLENVKSMLLQISQAPAGSIPGTLRDAADTLLQQVTGQQLMMVQPPNQAISQVVMQIPFRTPDGDDTAYVQVEAKKREGGDLDPDNCRLFFNLDLEQLGITMIDVAIVNRIVNVQIFNDQPWLEPIVQQARETFSAQLHETGYLLSNMRVQPIPEARGSLPAQSSKASLLSAYKGVDIRV
ncbi:hypothetical protein [Brevibacillus migulae]|uniref:hypothetical protein n=1 Tax=Brevibacillus migulae TaxID=1644114 RepID=UPI00106E6F91|nr:hypothetical protein [Brevibacillus migulae]